MSQSKSHGKQTNRGAMRRSLPKIKSEGLRWLVGHYEKEHTR